MDEGDAPATVFTRPQPDRVRLEGYQGTGTMGLRRKFVRLEKTIRTKPSANLHDMLDGRGYITVKANR